MEHLLEQRLYTYLVDHCPDMLIRLQGAIDEQSGGSFGEYVAILSGDTSLLEKSRLENKIAVIEGLRSAYVRELARARFRLESCKGGIDDLRLAISRQSKDADNYKSKLITIRMAQRQILYN